MPRLTRLLPWLACALAAAAAPGPVKAIVGATLVNSNGQAPVPDAVVLVQDGRILKAGPAKRVAVPKDAEVLDAHGRWLIPGLIDAHVHFFQSGGLYTRPDALDLNKDMPYAADQAAIRASLDRTFARYLRCGITGVMDCGGPFWNFEVRDRAAGLALAPHAAVTGPLVSTSQPPALTTDDPPILKVDSPEAAVALVRREAEKRPDFIKIWYIVSPKLGLTVEKGLPIVQATINESHRLGLRVAVHATQLETARAAVNAGADILVHSVEDAPVDDAFLALLKAHHTIYIPTLIVMGDYRGTFSQQLTLSGPELAIADPVAMGSLTDLRHLPDVPPGLQALIKAANPVPLPPVAMANLKKVQAAGITVAAGTDAGNIGTLHGPSLFRELDAMVQSGLSPQEVLTDTTLHGAEAMGRAKELGSIEAGKAADMVLLDADPLTDIGNLARIHSVVKGGQELMPAQILQDTPEEAVQRQVDAYNARNLNAFMATYAKDACVHKGLDAGAKTLDAGAMRESYGGMFAKTAGLHVQILKRMVMGGTVVDQERVTWDGVKDPVQAVAIYKVDQGLITEAWILK